MIKTDGKEKISDTSLQKQTTTTLDIVLYRSNDSINIKVRHPHHGHTLSQLNVSEIPKFRCKCSAARRQRGEGRSRGSGGVRVEAAVQRGVGGGLERLVEEQVVGYGGADVPHRQRRPGAELVPTAAVPAAPVPREAHTLLPSQGSNHGFTQ